MATNYTQGLDWGTKVYTKTSFFGFNEITSIVFIVLTLAIITRDVSKWRIMALPVTILYWIIGFKISIIWVAFVAVVFILEAVSAQTFENIFKSREKYDEKEKRIIDVDDLNAARNLGKTWDTITFKKQREEAKQRKVMKNNLTNLGFGQLPKSQGEEIVRTIQELERKRKKL